MTGPLPLHRRLHALAVEHGRHVLDDPARLHRALGGLADPPVPPADVALLTDAVRLGAYRALLAALDAGVLATIAVEDVARQLLADRADPHADTPARARWACAALGFAAGAVEADVVDLFDPAPPAAAATRRRPRLRGAVAVVAVLALVAGAVGAVTVLGDGAPGEPGAGATSAPTSGVPTSGGTTTPAIDPEGTNPLAVADRYRALADRVTIGMRTCRRVDPAAGETERLQCRFDDGTLELVTHRARETLLAGRTSALTDRPGGIGDVRPQGAVFGYEGIGRDGERRSRLYWDDVDARQSARYDGEPGVALTALARYLDGAGATRQLPVGPGSRALRRFAEPWVDPDRCQRIRTVAPGETEESWCRTRGGVEVYLGRFADRASFIDNRRLMLRLAVAADREVRTWTLREDEPAVGAMYEYLLEDGTAYRYWDRPDCLCFAQASVPDSDFDRLATWWVD